MLPPLGYAPCGQWPHLPAPARRLRMRLIIVLDVDDGRGRSILRLKRLEVTSCRVICRYPPPIDRCCAPSSHQDPWSTQGTTVRCSSRKLLSSIVRSCSVLLHLAVTPGSDGSAKAMAGSLLFLRHSECVEAIVPHMKRSMVTGDPSSGVKEAGADGSGWKSSELENRRSLLLVYPHALWKPWKTHQAHG